MKKFINKYMLLAVAACAFAACSDDDDNFVPGEWDASAGYADVYFPKTSLTEELEPTAACEATVQVMRRNTGSAVTVPMKVLSNTENVFTVSDAVFAAGDSVADVKITFPNAGIGSAFKVQFQPDGGDYVSSYSQDAIFSYSVTRIKWNNLGVGLFADWFFYDDFVEAEIHQRDDQPSIYRVVKPYALIGDEGSEYVYFQILKKGDAVLGQTAPYSDLVYWYSSDNKAYVNTGYFHSSYKDYIFACFPGRFNKYSDPSNWEYSYVGMRDEAGKPGQILLAPYYYMDSAGGWDYTQAEPTQGEGGIEILMPGFEKPEVEEIYVADIDADFEWEEVYTGVLTSEILGTTSNVALYVGTCVNNTDDCDKTFAETYGTVYALSDPYGPNSPIYFGVKEDGKITLPVAGPQATGMKALNEDVYAIINAKASSFSENMITLNMTFINKNGSIEYGTTDEVLSNIKWNSLGLATYTEDFITSFFKVENVSYQVEIQEREDMPGVYRLVDPYGAAYPYCQEGDFGATAYMTINCQDPEGCYIEYSPTTTDFGYGNFIMYSYAGYYLEAGYSLDQVKGAGLAGTLADGVITFPEGTLLVGMAAYKDGELVDANNNGAFSVVLPSAAPAEKPALAPKKSMTKTLKDLSGVKTVSRKNKLVGHPVETLVKPIKK